MEFKGTNGKWIVNKGVIKTENGETIGFAATLLGRVDKTRLPNESWLQMMERIKPERDLGEFERKANALLISKAPEMLEMLKLVSDGISEMDFAQLELMLPEIEQLIKSATEL